jgi:L-ascorbate metabolism protein UlaG (beta-lactamase superfamily)
MPKATFLGHACFQLEADGTSLIVDPFLTGNPKAARKADDVSCNYVLITHGHGDHLGDAISIAKRNNATIISNYEVATYCGTQGATSHPMHIGGSHRFPFGRVKLTIAHHGSGLQTDDGGMLYLGNPAGLLIELGGKWVYHAGDTGLFYDMKLIGETTPIDLALLPIGDNFTMGIDDAVRAAEFLQAKLTVPMHYGTFDIIEADPNEFVTKVKAKGLNAQVLPIGESLEF